MSNSQEIENSSVDESLSSTCVQIGRQLQYLARTSGISIFIFLFFSTTYFLLFNVTGAWGLIFILFGTVIPAFLWMRQKNPSIPLMLIVSLQTLFIYGIPILSRNESLEAYSEAEINSACFEILIFGVALSLGWLVTSKKSSPKNMLVHVFRFDNTNRRKLLPSFSLYLFITSITVKCFLLSDFGHNVLLLLPDGYFPLIRTVSDAMASGGSLLGSFCVGCGSYNRNERIAFWTIFSISFIIYTSSYLLSSITGFVSTAILGLFIGRRKIPTFFICIVVVILYVFNLSKFEMRERYWPPGAGIPDTALSDIPERTVEWLSYSVQMFSLKASSEKSLSDNKQTITNRVIVFGNLLFAQDAIVKKQIPILNGETYFLIPPLLMPRFIWPDKPRTHEGQIMLNVHFGRQTLESSYTTYIAWGLLPEAYANFGPYWGSFILGMLFGLIFGALEAWIRPCPIISLQSLLVLIIVIQIATSFENVASVMVTSLFQTIIVVFLGTLPFVDAKRIQVQTAN